MKTCKYCGAPLKKDWIALNKKLVSPELKEFICLDCMADDFCCEISDLEDKIEQFKEEGCKLF